jgi:hypothetical protein
MFENLAPLPIDRQKCPVTKAQHDWTDDGICDECGENCSNCLDPQKGVHAIDCPLNPRYEF